MLYSLIRLLHPDYISPHDRIIFQYKTQFSTYYTGEVYLREDANEYYVSLSNMAKQYVKPDDSVLDIGCGLGRLTFEFAVLGVRSCIGIDNSQYLIDEAKRISEGKSSYIRGFHAHGNHEFVHGDAQSLPFNSLSADLVICSNLIDRVAKPQRVINEIFRVLKRGGIFIYSDPYDWYELYTKKKFWVSDVRKLLPKGKHTILQRNDMEFICPIYSRRATVYMNDVCVIQKI